MNMDLYLDEMIVWYKIKTRDIDEEFRVVEALNEELGGNDDKYADDYLHNRIILNMSSDRRDGTSNEVWLIVWKDSKTVPPIGWWVADIFGSGRMSSTDNEKIITVDLTYGKD